MTRFSNLTQCFKISLSLTLIITGFFLILTASCSKETSSVTRIVIDNFENLEGEALLDKIGSIDLVYIPDSITTISRVQKISTSKKYNYILCGGLRSIINIFSKDWKFLGCISQYGKGEGKFQEITDFCHTASGNKVYILDYTGKKVLAFSEYGEFVSEKSIEIIARQMTYKNGDFFFFTKKFPNFGKHYSEIIVTDSTFNIVKDYFPIKELKPVRFSSSSVFSFSDNDELIFANSFRDTVFQLTSNRIQPYVILKMEDGIKSSQIKSRFHLDSIIKTGDFYYNNFLVSKKYYAFVIANKMALNTYIFNRSNTETFYTNGFKLLPDFYIGNPIGMIGGNLVMTLPASVVYQHKESWTRILDTHGTQRAIEILGSSDPLKNDVIISISLK